MITMDTLITDLIKEKPEAEAWLAESGMLCVGCASAEGETVAMAAAAHGQDPVMFIRKLNLRLFGRPF